MVPGFIVIEGTDGSGKSTLARLLTSEARVVESPPEPFRAVRSGVSASAAPRARLLYYLAGNVQVAHATAASDQRDDPWVAVRYVWSTLAYFAAEEDVSVSDLVRELEPQLAFVSRPDLVIMLSARPEELVRRALARRESGDRFRRTLDGQFQRRLRGCFDEALALISAPTVHIDTSNLTPAEVAAASRQAVGTHLR